MNNDLGQLSYTLTLNDEGFAGQLDSASGKVKASSEEMTAANQQVEESSGKAGGAFGSMAGQFIIAQAAFAIGQKALGAIKSSIDDAVKSYQAWTGQQTRTVAQLEATHDASGQTLDSMKKLAEQTQAHTGITREATLAGEDTLLTYTNIGQKVFPQATKEVADLAAKMANGIPTTQDTIAAAKALGMALDDPAKNYSRLKRAGVDFTADQIAQMKAMEASGNVQGAQNILLTAMNHHIADASYLTKTYQGQIQELRNKFNDFVGQALAKMIDGLKVAAIWLLAHKPILAAVAGLVTALAIAIGIGLVMALGSAIAAMGIFGVVTSLAFWEVTLAAAVIGVIAYEIVTHWNDLKQWFDDFMHWIKEGFKDVVDFIKKHWDLILDIILGPTGFVIGELIKHWKRVKQIFDETIKFIKDVFKDAMNILAVSARDAFGFIEAVIRPFYLFYKFIFETMYAIAMWLWHGILHYIVRPAVEGIKDALRDMWQFAQVVWNTLYNNIIHPVYDLIINGLQVVATTIGNIWNAVLNFARMVWNAIYGNVIKPAFDVILATVMSAWHIINGVWQSILDFARPIWQLIGSMIVGVWHSIVGTWQGMVSWFTNLFGGVTNAAGAASRGITGLFTGLWGTVKSAAKSGVNDVIGILNDMIRAYNDSVGKIPKAPHISPIPKFAGGVTNFSGGLALMGEQGPELAYLPPGSNVYPAAQTRQMMQSAGNSQVTYHIAKVELSTAEATRAFFSIGNRNVALELMGGSPLAGTAGV